MTTLVATAKTHEILEILDRDGAVILENFLTSERVDRILEELGPYIGGTKPVGDDFAGHQTTRTGGLVVRSQSVRTLVTEPTLLERVTGQVRPFRNGHDEETFLELVSLRHFGA